jgi:hypothetical protein
MRKGFLVFLFLMTCPLLLAQQSLNNDSIVKMVTAGLSNELIISMINSQAGVYDISADGLIALKKANVNDAVIGAMVKK